MKNIFLILVLVVGLFAESTKNFPIDKAEVIFNDVSCKDVQRELQTINNERGACGFCADKNDLYYKEHIVEGSSETIMIHRKTNLFIIGGEREDGCILINVYRSVFDLNDDGKNEVFFAYHNPYLSIPNLYLLQEEDGVFNIINGSNFYGSAKYFILSNKTNGYKDILMETVSPLKKKKIVLQYDANEYKIILDINRKGN